MSCDHIAAVRLVSRPGQRCRAARVVRFATRMRSRGNLVPPTICIKQLRLKLTEFGNYPQNPSLQLTFFGTRSSSRPHKHRQFAPHRIPLLPLYRWTRSHRNPSDLPSRKGGHSTAPSLNPGCSGSKRSEPGRKISAWNVQPFCCFFALGCRPHDLLSVQGIINEPMKSRLCQPP